MSILRQGFKDEAFGKEFISWYKYQLIQNKDAYISYR
jgi:hypothetical protein